MFVRTLLAALCAAGATACLPDGPPECEAGDEPPGPSFAAAQGGGGSCEPPPPCEGCGEGNGDPHVRTFDGLKFNFHTAAEVVAARAPDGSFEVQWRQQQLGTSMTAGIGAVAVRIDGSRITMVGGGSDVRIDGNPVGLEDGESVRLPTGVTVHLQRRKVMIVAADGDGAVHVNRHPAAIGVLVDAPDEHRGAIQGVLGNADGDPSNDVVLADGSVVADPTWDDVHPELGEAWRVTEANTLFDYEPGEGPDTFWDPTFPQRLMTLDDFTEEERAAAVEACRAAGVTDPDLLADCTFDVLVMGDPSYAELAAEQQRARGREPVPGGGAAAPVAQGDPALRFDTTLEGYRFNSRAEELVLDSAGHVLVQAIRDADGRHDLIAVDLADGSVAWTAPDIDASCTPTADPDGLIFAQLALRSATAGDTNNNADLVAIDPATGELVDGMRYTSPGTADEPRLEPCFGGLRLAPDDRVVLFEQGDSLWAFSTDGGSIEVDWRRDYPVTQHRTRPAISSDGSGVYHGYVAATDPLALAIERIDLESGEATGSSEHLGVFFSTLMAADDGGVVLGVRLSSSVGGEPEALVRLADDGESLAEDWRLVFDAAQPLTVGDQTFDENHGFRTFAIVNEQIVGYARGRILAVDRTDGDPVWVHSAAGTNNHDRMVVDTAGNLYSSSFGGYWMRAVSEDGVAWEIEPGAPLVTAQLREASRIGPVTEDGLLLVASLDEGAVIHLVGLELG
jgi:outer membrane protein assembly factor BamB